MTPKQQAQQLFDKFYIICQEYTPEIQCSLQAKECAILCVDSIMGNTSFDEEDYWIAIKTELEKL